MENTRNDKRGNRYSDEVRERAVRMVLEHNHEYSSQSAAISAKAPQSSRFGQIIIRLMGRAKFGMRFSARVIASLVVRSSA